MNKISPALMGLALLLFLLPWLTFSCGGQKVFTFSGTDLAIGKTIEVPQPFGKPKNETTREVKATIALLAGIAGLIASFSVKEERIKKIVLVVCGGIGGILMLILKSKLNADVFKEAGGMVTVDYHFGFWATMLLFFGVGILNILSLTGYLDKVSEDIDKAIPLKSPPQASFCSQCGAKVSPEDTFCSECGHSLK